MADENFVPVDAEDIDIVGLLEYELFNLDHMIHETESILQELQQGQQDRSNQLDAMTGQAVNFLELLVTLLIHVAKLILKK